MPDVLDRIITALFSRESAVWIVALGVPLFFLCVFMAVRGIRRDERLQAAKQQRQQNALYPLYCKLQRRRWLFLAWPPLLLVGAVFPVVRQHPVQALLLWVFIYLVCIVGGSLVAARGWRCPRCNGRLGLASGMRARAGLEPDLQTACLHCGMEFGPTGHLPPPARKRKKREG